MPGSPSSPSSTRQTHKPPSNQQTSTDASHAGRYGQIFEAGSAGPQRPQLPPVASLTGYTSPLVPERPPMEAQNPPARSFGVHSILNPTSEDSGAMHARANQSPRSTVGTAPAPKDTPLLPPRMRKRRVDTSPIRQATSPPVERPVARRVLTPKSNMRSLSQAVRASPGVGGVSRAVSSFQPGRETIIPPVPPLGRPVQIDIAPAYQQQDQNTPHGSYRGSSYPMTRLSDTGSPSGSSSLAEREELEGSYAEIRNQAPRNYGGNQQSYEMQLATDQGTMIVPVEVDLQQASKLADEKRKRNAGASARFRARRKEKEHVATQTIAELQRQVREITEQRDFYLSERNAIRDFATHTHGIQLPPRPVSPLSNRLQPLNYSNNQNEPAGNAEYLQRGPSEPPPAQRRRISGYQPTFNGPQPLAPAYTPQFPAPAGPPFSLPPMQDLRSPPSGVTASESHMATLPGPHPSSQAPSFDPFRRDTSTR